MMSAAAASIVCTNVGCCKTADAETALDRRTPSCPCCGKSLASPHTVTIGALSGSVEEGASVTIEATFKLRPNCSKFEEMWIEIDGDRHERAPRPGGPDDKRRFDIPKLPGGIHHVRAVLKTSDGRLTWSTARRISVIHTVQPYPLLMWALLLVLLLSMSASLNRFGVPFLGYGPPQWFPQVVDVVSILVAVLIGLLLIDLGFREATSAGSGQTLVRPQTLMGSRRVDRWLNVVGAKASSGIALVFIGALPLCFSLAYLLGILFGQDSPWGVVVAAVLVIVVLLALWQRERIATLARRSHGMSGVWSAAPGRSQTAARNQTTQSAGEGNAKADGAGRAAAPKKGGKP